MAVSSAVRVKRSRLFLGHGCLRPFVWLYECTGPDGTKFDNRSIAELRSVLRRRYGRNVSIEETWR